MQRRSNVQVFRSRDTNPERHLACRMTCTLLMSCHNRMTWRYANERWRRMNGETARTPSWPPSSCWTTGRWNDGSRGCARPGRWRRDRRAAAGGPRLISTHCARSSERTRMAPRWNCVGHITAACGAPNGRRRRVFVGRCIGKGMCLKKTAAAERDRPPGRPGETRGVPEVGAAHRPRALGICR